MSTSPDFVSFDSKGRDELLSQIGGFSPVEREIFQRLCDNWAPRIDAKRFLGSSDGSQEQEQTALERLMAKLRTAQIGFLTTTSTDAGVEPDQIMLTNTGSLDFWMLTLNEYIGRILAGNLHILPSEARLREHKAYPPDYHVVDADSSHLVAAYAGRSDDQSIYRIRLMGEFRVLFTGATARPLVTRALQVLGRDLVERGVIEELARSKDTSITEIRKRLESKAPDVWHDLARTLVKERATIAFRKNFEEDDELFELAYLVMVFVDAQIGEAREQKESDQLIDHELETIVRSVLEARSGTLSQDEFSTIVDEAQGRLGDAAARLSSRLSDELLKPHPRRKLPTVLYIHGLYIHSDRVRAVFEQARGEIAARLTREYAEIMEAFLRGRAPDASEIFGSRDMFNEDIARRVERAHPLLGEFIARPQLLAEAIIHDAKRNREGMSTEELKAVLTAYFDVESSQLKPLGELFELNMVAIFDEAFVKTSVFRQLLLRLSGRHESLRTTYIRRFGPQGKPRLAFADSEPPHGPDRARLQGDEVGARVRGTGNRSHRQETAVARHRRPRPQPAKPKRKSHNEIEQIWQEFDKALHTKPSKEDSP